MDTLLTVSNLSCSVSAKKILSNVSFEIKSSEIISVLGANGSGKTTLLKSILGLKQFEGEVSLSDKTIVDYSRKNTDFPVLEYVALARYANSSSRDVEYAKKALSMCLCEGLSKQMFSTLSGGEKQRVLLAAAICQEAKLFILDEPFSAMDTKNLFEMSSLVQSLKRSDKLSFLIVQHDVNLALRFSDKILFLDKGKQLFFGAPKEMLSDENFNLLFQDTHRKVDDLKSDLPLLVSKVGS